MTMRTVSTLTWMMRWIDGVQPLTGNRTGWRYRVDPYRIRYQPEKNQRNIILLRVGHRKNVYK